MDSLPKFLKKEKDSLLFNPSNQTDEFIFYIPEKYFERNVAEQLGEYISILGILNYTIQSANGKNIGLKTFYFPTIFVTKPDIVEKIKDVRLIKTSKPTNYRLLHYKKDSIIVVNTKVTQFIGNVEKFLNLFTILGYIPNTIPYDTIQNYFVDAIGLNGESFNLNMQMFGFIISEICRSNKDMNIPWRLSGNNDLNAYESTSVKNISKLISPYTAIESEDFDESVLHAMKNENPKDSTLEKILMGD